MMLWTIPAERFKAEAEHLVPISGDARDLLSVMPRFQRGDHLFSATFGRTPIFGLSKAKAKLDRLMAEKLGAEPTPFVVHDIRRTVRTRLSALTTSEVAELVIGHGKKGLARVYDQHQYETEMRDALESWARALRSIMSPPEPGSVVEFRKKGKRA